MILTIIVKNKLYDEWNVLMPISPDLKEDLYDWVHFSNKFLDVPFLENSLKAGKETKYIVAATLKKSITENWQINTAAAIAVEKINFGKSTRVIGRSSACSFHRKVSEICSLSTVELSPGLMSILWIIVNVTFVIIKEFQNQILSKFC